MISACNPLSHYWTETLSKRPYLVAQKWILVGLQILGDLAQSNQFFFAPPPPPITMSIVLSVWESIQLTMKHTMQRILGSLRRHLDGEGWRQQDGFAPYMGPGHTATPQTLYEIGHIVTHADPICGHLR